NFEYWCGRERCCSRTDCNAENSWQRPDAYDFRDDRAFLFMPKIGSYGGRNDNRQRGANTRLDTHLFGHIQYTKHFVQNWHNDRAAPNPEQPCKNANHDASARYQEREQNDLAKRISKQHDSSRKTGRLQNLGAMCAKSPSLSST